MDIVELKYNGMKIFLEPKIEDSSYRLAMKQAPLTVFLRSLDQYNDKNPKEITNIISKKFNIDISKHTQEDIHRFETYIEYFLQVNKAMK